MWDHFWRRINLIFLLTSVFTKCLWNWFFLKKMLLLKWFLPIWVRILFTEVFQLICVAILAFDYMFVLDFLVQKWNKFLGIFECTNVHSRVHPRFFDQVGYETMNASSGNKHFFTKSCHRQTYQNYEQSRQKMGTILENKVS